MKKKTFSLLVVDLSTSPQTAGARIVPLADYFIKKKHKIIFLMNKATKKTYLPLLGARGKKISITTFPFSDSFPNSKILIGLEYLKRMAISLFIKIDQGVDIIYSLTGIICDVFPSLIFKKRFNKIWVANIDNVEAPPSQKPGPYLVNLFSFLLFKLSVFFLRYADVVFVTTPLKEVRETLIKRGVHPNKIVLSNNGIALEYIKKISPGKKQNYGASFLGRIHKGKGVFDLVEIWRGVIDRLPQAGQLVLVGSGEKETIDRLKKLVKKKALTGKVFLAGFVDEQTKYQLLKGSRIFLYPSYYDANPISTVEALACRLPIVAYNLPVFLEHYPRNLIQGVSRGDIQDFTRKVLGVLKNKQKREQLRKAGFEFAKEFNWPEIFKKQEKIISDLITK